MTADFTDSAPAPLTLNALPSIPESVHIAIDRHAIAYSRFAHASAGGDKQRMTLCDEALTSARRALNNAILSLITPR